jgi:hypothetical protein
VKSIRNGGFARRLFLLDFDMALIAVRREPDAQRIHRDEASPAHFGRPQISIGDSRIQEGPTHADQTRGFIDAERDSIVQAIRRVVRICFLLHVTIPIGSRAVFCILDLLWEGKLFGGKALEKLILFFARRQSMKIFDVR